MKDVESFTFDEPTDESDPRALTVRTCDNLDPNAPRALQSVASNLIALRSS